MPQGRVVGEVVVAAGAGGAVKGGSCIKADII